MHKEELLALLKAGACVLTPNNRLSNDLLLDFLHLYPHPVQERPLCLPYGVFLQEWFRQLCHQQPQIQHPILLTAQQSRHLWRQILFSKGIEVNSGLLSAVEEAWTRCNLWLIDFKHPSFDWTHQTRCFRDWVYGFLKQLENLKALTTDQLAVYLISQHASTINKKFIWACFDDYTPEQKSLKNYLVAQGSQVFHFDIKPRETCTALYAASNEEEEFEQLIAWLNEQLKEGKTRIGVVFPDLESKSALLQRKLQNSIPSAAFNISLGNSLINYPLVSHAIHWLFLNGETLSLAQARLLLASPFLGHSQTEHFARSQMLEQSNVLKAYDFSQEFFIIELEKIAPKLATILNQLNTYPQNASVQVWFQLFYERLKILEFPGEISLDSQNYQCYQRFLSLLDEFKQLALISKNLSQSDALLLFKDLAESTIFQPRKSLKPVQILGLLEASGCSFNSIWITGLTF